MLEQRIFLMSLCQFTVFTLVVVGATSTRTLQFDVDQCRSEVREARERLADVIQELASEEADQRSTRLYDYISSIEPNFGMFERGENITEDCGGPQPPTMFPPTVITSNGLEIPSIFPLTGESDVYVKYMSTLHASLLDEEAICNGPKFAGLNSITEQQLYGALTVFAVNYAAPLCDICEEFVGAARNEIIELLSQYPRYKTLVDFLLKYLPSNKVICSLLPACKHPDDKRKHKVLLNQDIIDFLSVMLNRIVFKPFCLELCYAYPPHKEGQKDDDNLFPKGITQKECLGDVAIAYKITVKLIQNAFIPNRFCPLFGACKTTNPTPNGLHCLRLLCIDLEHKYSFLAPICDLIPDHPDEADKYLNIHRQKEILKQREAEELRHKEL